MAISPYILDLREHVGHDLLLLPSVSAVVVDEDGQILLLRRADDGRWSLPGGAVDPGEQPADAVVRETYEETGVHVAVEHIAGVALHPVAYPNGDQCQYLNVWFRCRAVGGTAGVNDEESLAVGWFSLEELPEVNPYVRLRIDTALGDGGAAWFARPGERHEALRVPDAL
ncbi:NUDIX domain-containing protein [Planosporangium thailandense]|uniref:NUDIX domain-containing protein n=1 Tax=Planosporangium thailandense TaxID=765197 RepID=A0ABX0Y682_9ACTN|nr:NUDIX domain-containing protein [Planosporangium thailandense]